MSKPPAPPSTGRFVRHELMTTDAAASARFYGGLWGWNAAEEPLADATYTRLRGKGGGQELGGLYAMPEDMQRGRVAPHWTPMLAVDDCDAALARAKALGGRAVTETFELLGLGRMALVQDPTGAPFGLWQGEADGAAGAWHELSTTDGAAAAAFYGALLGWEAHVEDRGSLKYTTFTLAGEPVAGLLDMGPRFPGIPSHWLTYFPATRAQAAAEAVTRAGGRLLVPPHAAPGLGLQAVAQDPQGATFGLVAPE